MITSNLLLNWTVFFVFLLGLRINSTTADYNSPTTSKTYLKPYTSGHTSKSNLRHHHLLSLNLNLTIPTISSTTTTSSSISYVKPPTSPIDSTSLGRGSTLAVTIYIYILNYFRLKSKNNDYWYITLIFTFTFRLRSLHIGNCKLLLNVRVSLRYLVVLLALSRLEARRTLTTMLFRPIVPLYVQSVKLAVYLLLAPDIRVRVNQASL
jgi:hypothetical protein